MLDIGSLEIFLIIVIALLVIGPQRLPEVAKILGQTIGKFRHTVNRLKEVTQVNQYIQEFKDEMGLQEQQELNNTIMNPINQVTDEIQEVVQTIKSEGKKLSSPVAKKSKSVPKK